MPAKAAEPLPASVSSAGYTPDFTVDILLDTVDANPGDGICADASGQCTLRAAIMEANALDFSVTIYAPAGTYNLTLAGMDEDLAATGDLDIRKPMTIYGDGPQATIIDAHQMDRVFHITPNVPCARTDLLSCFPFVWISSLTVQGGSAPYGGGVYQQDQWAFFTDVDFINNEAYSSHPCTGNAGAAYLNLVPQANIAYSRFINNHTPSTSISTAYGVIAGHAILSYVSVDQNNADWALINSGSSCDAPYDGQFVLSNTSITHTTGGAAYAESLEMAYTTISTNGAGIHLYNTTGDFRTMVGRTYIDEAFNHSTIAYNNSFGIKLDDVAVSFSDLIVANNGANCVGAGLTNVAGEYRAGVATDDSCSPIPHRFWVTNPGLMSLTLVQNRYYHPISQGGTGGRGDTGPSPMPLQIGQIRSTRYHDDAIYTPFSNPTLPSNDQLFVPFRGERLLYNPSGDSDVSDVTNPNNYQLIMPGSDSIFQTSACNSLSGDDVLVPIESVSYFDYFTPTKYMYNLYVGPSVLIDFDELVVGGSLDRLPASDYRLIICGTLITATNDGLDSDYDGVADGQPYIVDFTADPLPYPGVTSSFALISDEQVDIQVEFDTLMDAYQLLSDEPYHRVVYAGSDGIVDTSTCEVAANDDRFVDIANVQAGTSAPNITLDSPFDILQVSVEQPLSPGLYVYLLCDTVHDVEGTPLDGDGDGIAGGNHLVEFVIGGLLTPNAPTLNDYSDVLVVLNLPTVSAPEGTVFQIERTGGGTTAIVGSTSLDMLIFVDDNLVCETAYRYRVRLYNESMGGFGEWSDYLDVATANCVASLQHTFGLYKEGQWLFYAVDGYQREDVRFAFGEPEPGWTALVGDWNGDGLPGIGLYKDGTFMLRDLNGSSVTDLSFDFGTPTGAVPVVGDWDGNGTDTIGVFLAGTFFLRNSNDAGPSDLTFGLGNASSIPLAGDWDGDGTDSVGYFENNAFYLATDGVSPTIYTSFSFGPLGWSPIFGDWNGDLTDTIGLYNNGLWRLRNSNDAGPVEYGFTYGDLTGGWQPLSFDGDTSVLNRLFAATVPTPRVPVIPGPELPVVVPTMEDQSRVNWIGQFYNSTDLSGGVVAFGNYLNGLSEDWGLGQPSDDVITLTAVNADNFSARFTANVNLTPGRYQFFVSADDGARMSINGVSIIDFFDNTGLSTRSATVNISGPTTLSVEYVDHSGSAFIQVQWVLISNVSLGSSPEITSTNTPLPTYTSGPDATPPTSTLTLTPSDTPEFTNTPQPTSTPLLNPLCPSLEFSCQQLFDCEEAYACYDSGNTDLDADNNGVPCEAELHCTPR
ncbi:MAG: hypothetical protein H6670_16125 [Anaerolineaceae bacterium]|nr:hypothetical protein [Anaerolineaceae bacterium]